MNVLIESLPTKVEVNEAVYEINSDFRTALLVIVAFEDMDLSMHEKYLIMLDSLYPVIPDDVSKAAEIAIKFLNCGEEETGFTSVEKSMRLYSFEKDGKYIYSAIKQSHNIDLESIEYLHWWKFCYMFMDLREDCFFNKMIYLRKQKQTGKLSKEERTAYTQMKDILDLPKIYTTEELEELEEVKRILGIEVIK